MTVLSSTFASENVRVLTRTGATYVVIWVSNASVLVAISDNGAGTLIVFVFPDVSLSNVSTRVLAIANHLLYVGIRLGYGR